MFRVHFGGSDAGGREPNGVDGGRSSPSPARWSHHVLGVDGHGRLALHPWLAPGTGLDASLHADQWRLRVCAGGRLKTDSRSRLGVPIGIRVWLGLESIAGVSWRDGEAVVWSPGRLDALLGDLP